MPWVRKPHGKREKHQVWAELTLPAKMYKVRQAFSPLRNELMQKDPAFRRDVSRIIQGMNSHSISLREADSRYFTAIDEAVRRRRRKVA